MARHFYSRRLHRVTLWMCVVVAVVPSGVVRAGGGLAAIDAFHVGRYHLTCGDRNKALDAFNDALRLNPQFVQAYIARGKLLAEMGEFDSALADLNFALRLQPTHAEGFAYRGFVLLSQGKPEESLPEFDMALRIDPSYARVHYLRGQALRGLGNEMGADASIAMAYKLDPSIENLKTMATTAGENGAVGVRMNAPAGLERTSLMADITVPPRADLPKEMQGRVVRFENHPQLANIYTPFGANRDSQQSQTPQLPDAATARRPTITPPHPKESTETEELKTVRQPQPGKLSSSSDTKNVNPAEPKSDDKAEQLLAKLPEIMPPPSLELTPADGAEPAPQPAAVEVTAPVVVNEQPALEAAPPASAILAGAAAKEAVSKPTPETSQARIAEAIAATQQSAAESSSTPAAEKSADLPTVEPVAAVEDKPASVENAAAPELPTPPMLEAAPAAVVVIGDEPSQPGVAPAVPTDSGVERARSDAELCRLRGVEREEQGDPSAALREYENSIRLDPTNPQSYCLRGRLFLKAQHTTEAAADFEQAIRLAPGLAIGYYGRGHARYLQGEFADAVDDYTVCLRLDDCHALALIERGHCLAQLGEAEKAELDRQAAIALDPSLAKTGPKYGNALPKAPVPTDVLMPTETPAAFVSDAPAKVEQTAASEPAAASAFGDLFTGGEPVKQPQTLPTDVTTAASTDGVAVASDRAPVVSGNAVPSQPELTPVAQPANELQPAATEPADLLPSSLNEQPLHDGAAQQELKRLSDELSRAPGDSRLYVRRAEAQLNLGRAEDAVDDLNAALRIEPTSVEALTLRAQAHEEAQRLPAAVADLNELLRLKPNDGALLARRGGAKLALGLIDEAVADLTQGFAAGHDSAESYCRRGLAFAVQGNAQQAMADFAAALEREPNNAEIFVCRGRAFAEFNRPAEALADFNRAVECDPKCADAYFERSRLYALKGAYEKSQSDRVMALKLDPTLR